MQKILTLLCCYLLCTHISYAQYQHPNVLISSNQNPSEPAIAIDPRNPDVIVAGANLNASYYSTDAGLTWTENMLGSSLGERGDPCITVDNAGNFYYFHLAENIDRVICQKSTDGGVTWTDGSFTQPATNGQIHDKEWGYADPTTNSVYVTWTEYEGGFNPALTDSTNILFSSSFDGAQTWSVPQRINKIRGDCLYKDVVDPNPATGPNGEVYATWADSTGVRFDRSLDYGVTWLDDDIQVAPVLNSIYYHISGNARDSLRTATNIECDLSDSPNRGNIYISWMDDKNGLDNIDIFMAKSTDGGTSWSEPKRVNDDAGIAQQYYHGMTIDQATGYLYFIFYDRRNHPNTDSTDVYMAVSTDAGETFTNFKVSETPFLANNFAFVGDYLGVAAQNNVVRPIWVRIDNFWVTSVMTAIVNVDMVTSLPHHLSQNTASISNYPNPFAQFTTLRYTTTQANTQVQGFLFDIQGKQVATWQQNTPQIGTYEYTLDARSLPAGIYACQLLMNGNNYWHKIILSR